MLGELLGYLLSALIFGGKILVKDWIIVISHVTLLQQISIPGGGEKL